MEAQTPFERHLKAAEDFTKRGMHWDAHEELKEIDPELRDRSEVLQLRVIIYRTLREWEMMQTVARILALRDPNKIAWTVAWAHATRRVESGEASRDILLDAVQRIPTAAALYYCLACNECQLGKIGMAKACLRHAFNLDPKLRTRALEEEDLRPLWDSITAIA